MSDPPVLLAIDGPSIGHRFYHALLRTAVTDPAGRPAWAVHGFVRQLLSAAARFNPSAVIVGFDDPTSSTRRNDYPQYKAGRAERPPELLEQLDAIVQLMRAAGVQVAVPAGLEADDVLASASRAADQAGWRTVLVTSDRDAYALVTPTTSLLWVTASVERSTVLDPAGVAELAGVAPDQYSDYAAFRGDPSDNLPGVPGVGKKTAVRLLAEFGSGDAVFVAAAAEPSRVAAAVGTAAAARLADPAAREAFCLTRRVMTLQTEVDLGCPVGEVPGRLPLDPALLAAALTTAGLDAIRGSAGRLLATPRPDPAATATARSTMPVSAAGADPYHCVRCGQPVVPHAKSVAHGEPVVCRTCDLADPRAARLRERKGPAVEPSAARVAS